MTRINLVKPQDLCDQHLLAEYRELPRAFKLARRYWAEGKRRKPLPASYTLGAGHVTFFYDKCGWLITRQFKILGELHERGFNIRFNDPQPLVRGLPAEAFKTWSPSFEEMQLSKGRINERLQTMNQTQRGKPRWSKIQSPSAPAAMQ